MRRACAGWCVAVLLAWLCAGCDAGITPLSGGSVPIGDIDGRVTYATGPAAQVPVTLLDAGGKTLAATATDAAGGFVFAGVDATQVTVRAQDARRTAEVRLEASELAHAALVLQLADPLPDSIVSLLLDPAWAHVAAGERIHFTALGIVARQDNRFVPVPASWAIRGRIGTIDAGGHFQATRAGSGRVIAQYGTLQAVVAIQVYDAGGAP